MCARSKWLHSAKASPSALASRAAARSSDQDRRSSCRFAELALLVTAVGGSLVIATVIPPLVPHAAHSSSAEPIPQWARPALPLDRGASRGTLTSKPTPKTRVSVMLGAIDFEIDS